MSDSSSRQVRDALKRDRQQLQEALDETLDETFAKAWLPNTIAWIAVVGGSFLVNLLVMVLIAGK